MMRRSSLIAAVAALLLLWVSLASAQRQFAPPPGTKVVTASFFEIYVLKKEEGARIGDYTPRVFQATIVARTTKHGTQRFTQRLETLDSDLLDAKNWEIADLDGDGLEDLRYLAQQTKAGCKMWSALRWEKDRERFTLGGAALARAVDASGKKLPNCVMR
jgi:hypothetical protein